MAVSLKPAVAPVTLEEHMFKCNTPSQITPESSSPFVNVGPMCPVSVVFTVRN